MRYSARPDAPRAAESQPALLSALANQNVIRRLKSGIDGSGADTPAERCAQPKRRARRTSTRARERKTRRKVEGNALIDRFCKMLIQGEIEMCIKRPAIAIRLQLRAAHLNGARLRGSIRAEPAEHAGYRNDCAYPPQNGRFAPLCWQGAPLLPVQAVRQGALRRPARQC